MSANGTVRIYRPAAMGYSCDDFDLNPAYGIDPDAPLLLRCNCPAEAVMVIQDALFTTAVKRCHNHAQRTRKEAAADGNEIISDEPIPVLLPVNKIAQ